MKEVTSINQCMHHYTTLVNGALFNNNFVHLIRLEEMIPLDYHEC